MRYSKLKVRYDKLKMIYSEMSDSNTYLLQKNKVMKEDMKKLIITLIKEDIYIPSEIIERYIKSDYLPFF